MPYNHQERIEAAQEALREGDIDDVERLIAADVVEVEDLDLEDNDPLKRELEAVNDQQEQDDRWLEAKALTRKGQLSEAEAQLVLDVALDRDDKDCAEAALRNIRSLDLRTDLAEATVINTLQSIIESN